MAKGKTPNGFKFDFDDRIIKDWRFVNAIADSQSTEPQIQIAGATKMINLLLGSDGLAALEKFIADRNDGFVPTEALMEEVRAILESSQKLKN